MQPESPVLFRTLIADYLRVLHRPLPAPDMAAPPMTTDLPARRGMPCALLLSSHPDDECLTGALPLRLMREQGWHIVNLAVTLGSKPEARERRTGELAKACAVLGFDGTLPVADGFSNINAETRDGDPVAWRQMVMRLADIVAHLRPQAVFMPHAQDWNATHIGVHWLGMDALALQPADFSCAVAQTEYWQPLAEPNVMIGISESDAAKLLTALSCHAGEVARNPYDKRFPSFLIDNVRRGSERIGGKGVAAAPMDFAMLYKIGLWRDGRFMPSALKRIVGVGDPVGALFE